MKYAIISDIHGNNYAFTAVLEDAKAQGVDEYLLLGDYVTSYTQGNEVVDNIRSLPNATVIKGNGEDYFYAMRGKSKVELTHEQYKPVYWGYSSLSPENLDYVLNLPDKAAISDSGVTINLAHSMDMFFRKPKIDLFHSNDFRILMSEKPFSHEDYLQYARESFVSAPGVLEEVLACPPNGVYLLGHNHLQFFMEYERRLFINPGSCGEPLDWDTQAAYTILTVNMDGSWEVEERRVEYDVRQVVNRLDASGFTEYAPVWSDVLKMDITTAKDCFQPFVNHVMETGRRMDEFEAPVGNGVWEVAVGSWDMGMVGERNL